MTRLFAAVGAVGLMAGAALGAPPSPTPAELVAKLGSDEYAAREAAARALARLGPEALPALRDALKSSDPEVRARVAPLITQLQRTADSAGRLTPKKLALNYKDVPLATALADFKLRSGLNLVFDTAKVADPLRAVTVSTAEVSVWEALDAFCTAAGLREEFRSELEMPKVQNQNRRAYTPPPQIPGPDAVPVVLVEGTPRAVPGDRRTAVRVLALPASFPGHRVTLGTGDTTLCFDVAPQPGLNWVDVTAVKVTRLTDDAGRVGGAGRARSNDGTDFGDEVVAFAGPGGFGGFGGRGVVRFNPQTGMPIYPDTVPNPRIVEVPLKLATPSARSIKRLDGSVLGEVLLTNQTLLTVADPTKTTGTAHDGLGNFRLTVQGVTETKAGGTQVQLVLQYPPPWARRGGFNPGGIWPESPRPGATPTVQAFDAAGKAMPASTSGGYSDSSDDGQTMYQHVTMTFRKDAGVPAKFVVTGSRPVTVEVPFVLENVPLP
jgi:hypothetical protein